jgi:Pectate lyase superfamily protein
LKKCIVRTLSGKITVCNHDEEFRTGSELPPSSGLGTVLRARSVIHSLTIWKAATAFAILAIALGWPGNIAVGASAFVMSPYYDVSCYGAKGDGATNDTTALQAAIDAAASRGGGVVLLPPGSYLSGTIHLRSRVTLDLREARL